MVNVRSRTSLPAQIAARLLAAGYLMAAPGFAQQPPDAAAPGLQQSQGAGSVIEQSVSPEGVPQNVSPETPTTESVTAAQQRLIGIPGYLIQSEAPAKQFLLSPSVTAQITSTTNATLKPGHNADEIISFSPTLSAYYTSARFLLNGLFSFDGIESLHRTEPDRVLPRGSLTLNANLYDSFLFLDAGINSTESTENPFLGRNPETSTTNLVATTQARISPYISREIAPDLVLIARSDNTYTQSTVPNGDAENLSGYLGKQTIKLEALPLPLGWATEFGYSENQFESKALAALRDSSVRVTADYSAFGDALVGLLAGFESVDIESTHVSHNILGVFGEWHPSPLTDLQARAESRYFGTGWDVRFTNHGPLDAFTVVWGRAPTTYQEELSSAPVGSTLSGLLNQILSSQVLGAGERSLNVQSILQASGFPQSLPGSQVAYTDQPMLVDSVLASAYLLGKSNSLTVSVYRTRSTELLAGETLVALSGAPKGLTDNVQYGTTFDLSHTLSPTATISGSLNWAITAGLGANSGEVTRQSSLVIRLTERISRRTTVFAGLRRQIVSASTPPTVTESAAFLGLTEGF